MRLRWVLFVAALVIMVSFWGYQNASKSPTSIKGIWAGQLLDGNDAAVGNLELTISAERNYTGILVPVKASASSSDTREKPEPMYGYFDRDGEISGTLKSTKNDVRLFEGNVVRSMNRIEGTIIVHSANSNGEDTPYKIRLERK